MDNGHATLGLCIDIYRYAHCAMHCTTRFKHLNMLTLRILDAKKHWQKNDSLVPVNFFNTRGEPRTTLQCFSLKKVDEQYRSFKYYQKPWRCKMSQ